MMRDSVSPVLAAIGVMWCVVMGGWLWFTPMRYVIIIAGGPGQAVTRYRSTGTPGTSSRRAVWAASIRHSGWPISYEEVRAHYPRANTVCEAGEFAYEARRAVPGGMHPLLKDFAPEDFSSTRHANTWRTIKDLQARGLPVW